MQIPRIEENVCGGVKMATNYLYNFSLSAKSWLALLTFVDQQLVTEVALWNPEAAQKKPAASVSATRKAPS